MFFSSSLVALNTAWSGYHFDEVEVVVVAAVEVVVTSAVVVAALPLEPQATRAATVTIISSRGRCERAAVAMWREANGAPEAVASSLTERAVVLTDRAGPLTDATNSRNGPRASLRCAAVTRANTPFTPAVQQFLARTDVPTPYVVIDLDLVQERYELLRNELPEANVFYAVKANPARGILERLQELGSSFDVASPAEIDFCLAVGASPEQISYGNTIKKRRDIAYAASCGVRRFTIDSEPELEKIVDVAPGSEVCVRLRHDCGGADWPLSRKFGALAPDVVRVMIESA